MATIPENSNRREVSPAEVPVAAPRRGSWLFAYPVAWVVLGISLAASTGGWFIAREHQDLTAQKQFDEEASRIQTALSERMSVYQDVLHGGAGLFAASHSVERAEWKAYVETVSVNKRFPGMDWLGFIADAPRDRMDAFLTATRDDGAPDFQLKNPGTNDDLFIVKYIEPEAEHHSMLGVDMNSDAGCRAIEEQALDTGLTIMSGRLQLKGSDQKTHDGLIMFTPVYRNGSPVATPQDRHANIAGWVFAGFITERLMNSILGEQAHMLHFQVFEETSPGSEALIFDSDTGTNQISSHYRSRFASVDTLSVGRHIWVLRFNSRPGFDAAIPRFTERFVAVGGGLISLLLFGIALVLSATRARALIMATEMTAAFRDANARLEMEIGEREHAERRIAAQYAVARVLAEAESLPEATPRILQSICESLNWDVGAVWQIDPVTGQMHCVELWCRTGLLVGEFKSASQGMTFKRGEGLPGRVWAGGKPVWISDVIKDANFPRKPSAMKAGLHGALGFPVLAGDKVMGVIEFFSHRIEAPDGEMLDMLTAAGSQIGQFMERKQSETALDRERYLMKTLMDNLPDRIYFKDIQSRFIRNNRAHLDKFGLDDPALALGKSDFDFFTDEHARQAFDDEQQIMRTGQPMTKEEKETRPDGNVTWALSTKMPMRDEQGNVVGTFGISRDITARRRAEDALRVAKEAAEEGSRAKSQFLASMSHELRTPLNSVIGFANILSKNKGGNLSASELTFLDRIIANGKHLLSLINEILDLSKVEARKLELQIAPTDLGALIRETVAQQESLVRDRPVQLLADLPALIAPFPTDAEKLKQVIINLIGNALKFTDHGSVTVRLVTDPSDHHPLRIDVVDTGIGIPQDKLGIIFEAFQQAEAGTTRKYGGTGLGLTISQALCQLMGYHISVTSEMGHGSTFSVMLKPTPEVPAGVSSVAFAPPVAPPPAGGPVALSGRRVLVIDDELDSRTLLTHLITECGCQVVAASSGAQGLQIAREFKPDLITLDLMMPSMDGWQVVRAIKADLQLAHIPVVVVSVVGSENRGHILGAVDVLQKPVSREDLAAVLQRNMHVSASRILIVDDDADARQIMSTSLQDRAVEIRTATNGQEALELLEKFPPDLIVLDLMMPVMDGITFLDSLRRDPRYQSLPVVITTAKALTPAEVERLKLEKLRVLNKAQAFDGSLKRLIEDLLQKNAPPTASQAK
jgi:PAS domain S-box-containing protein